MVSLYRPIVILAKSYKLKQRCIAGIFQDTGEWVRPVSQTENGSIDQRLVQDISILDVVEVPLMGKPDSPVKYQRENWLIGTGEWRKCGKADPKKLLNYCDDKGLILHNHREYVEPDYLDRIPSSEWKSLELIRVRARFEERIQKSMPKKRILFKDGKGNELNLPITDEDFIIDRFTKVKGEERDCLITISLAKPWGPADGSLPLRCYKLAAGIIELS